MRERVEITPSERTYVEAWVDRQRAAKISERKFDARRTSREVSLAGKLGEVGCAKFFAAKVDWRIHPGGDSGIDLRIGLWAWTVAIKTTVHRRGGLPFNAAADFSAQLAVLVYIPRSDYRKPCGYTDLIGCVGRIRFFWEYEMHVLQKGNPARLYLPYGKVDATSAAALRDYLQENGL